MAKKSNKLSGFSSFIDNFTGQQLDTFAGVAAEAMSKGGSTGSNVKAVVVRVEDYNTSTQQLTVSVVEDELGKSDRVKRSAITVAPVPTDFMSGARLQAMPDNNQGKIQLAIALDINGGLYILGYFSKPSVTGYLTRTTNEPKLKPGDIFLKHQTKSYWRMFSEGISLAGSSIRNAMGHLYFDDWAQIKFDRYRKKVWSKISNLDSNFSGGYIRWKKTPEDIPGVENSDPKTQLEILINKMPERQENDVARGGKFADPEKHNEDIMMPLANPTFQNYIDKLVLRAGKMDGDDNVLLDMQTRQASGGGYNIQDFPSLMEAADKMMIKDAFSRLRLGLDKGNDRLFVYTTKQFTDKASFTGDATFGYSSLAIGRDKDSHDFLQFYTKETYDEGEEEETTHLNIGRHKDNGYMWRQRSNDTRALTTSDYRLGGVDTGDGSVQKINISQDEEKLIIDEARGILAGHGPNAFDGVWNRRFLHDEEQYENITNISLIGTRTDMLNFDDGSTTQNYIKMVGVEALGTIYEKLEFADSSNEVVNTKITGPNDAGTWMKDEKLEYATTELTHHLKIGDADDAVLFSEELLHPSWNSSTIVDSATPSITTSQGAAGTECVITTDGTGTTSLVVGETNKVIVDSEGNITIHHDTDLDIKTLGTATVTVTGDAAITASTIALEGEGSSMVEINGAAPPNNQGAFCALPACLFTGAPHIGSQAMTKKIDIK